MGWMGWGWGVLCYVYDLSHCMGCFMGAWEMILLWGYGWGDLMGWAIYGGVSIY